MDWPEPGRTPALYKIFMTKTNRIPEILAPAGTYEAMEAAVKAGCDAVYAGGSFFSARAYAGNFDQESFLKAIDECHFFGVRVYMTVNTLLKEEETEQLVSYVRPYYEAGLDGVLVQDMGVYEILRQAFPDLPLHVSTQMSISSAYGAQMAKELGFTRIVPSRELSLAEIKEIKHKVDIEVETFVHGALCFAYSGKCLLSSFAGGRSGNRGRCAQPCRQCYELFHTGTEEGGPSVKEYLMSLSDICMLKELPLLIDAGIDSFKIEGRMKNPSYVASVVDAYRRERDLYLELKANEQAACFEELSRDAQNTYLKAAETDTERLAEIYNRGGFCSGYYHTDKGIEMAARKRPNHQGVKIGTVVRIREPEIAVKLERDLHRGDVYELRKEGREVIELTSGKDAAKGETVSLKANRLKQITTGMEVWRTRNAFLLEQIETELLRNERFVSVNCRIEARVGFPLRITLTAAPEECREDPVTVCAEGEPVQAAEKTATDAAVLTEKMKRSSQSALRILHIACEADPDAFVPMSQFNVLRRKAAEEFREKIIAGYHRQSEN